MAFQKKSTLDDLLLLATGTPESALLDEVALHFYTGLRSLTQLQASIECPLQKLWACAEGLRLLFDANAVWIHDGLGTPQNRPWNSVREVASLTSSEKKALRKYLWERTPIPTVESQQCGVATWARLAEGKTLGDVVTGLSNSNLEKTQSVLWLTVNGERTWSVAFLLPGEVSEGPREAVNVCRWLMGSAQGVRCNALVAGFRGLEMPFGAAFLHHDKYWRPRREQIKKKLQGLSLDKFHEVYREEFWAMHGVLRVLHEKFTRLIKEVLHSEDNPVRIIFSYRVPEEDSIRAFYRQTSRRRNL